MLYFPGESSGMKGSETMDGVPRWREKASFKDNKTDEGNIG
jgi:hypothetical protein